MLKQMLNQSANTRLPELKVPRATILHADDDRVNRKLVETMLSKEGYHVEAVPDGRQCLQWLSSGRQPDIILMDVEMPELDGIAACREIRSIDTFDQIPVIFVTSHTDDKTLQAAFDAGGNDYVRKPISRVELNARVATALAQRVAVERRVEQEKLKGALETAGAVCHELNQPLQYILGVVQLLMLDVDDKDPVWKRLNDILQRIFQMGEITRKLGDITYYRTRKYVGDRDIIDLEQSVASLTSVRDRSASHCLQPKRRD